MLYIAYILLYALLFFFGASIASFLNALVYRLPKGISPFSGRSRCSSCNHTLSARDLIPVFGYLLLGGRCRYCNARIQVRHAVTEAIFGILCALLYTRYTSLFLFYFAIACILYVVARIDWETREISHITILLLLLFGIASIWLMPDITLLARVIGFFAISLPMLMLSLLIQGAFGGGDIKLMAACGFLLGWQNSLLAFFLALITGGAYAVYLLKTKKTERKAHMAFGPFLALGIMIALVYGRDILGLYIGLL